MSPPDREKTPRLFISGHLPTNCIFSICIRQAAASLEPGKGRRDGGSSSPPAPATRLVPSPPPPRCHLHPVCLPAPPAPTKHAEEAARFPINALHHRALCAPSMPSITELQALGMPPRFGTAMGPPDRHTPQPAGLLDSLLGAKSLPGAPRGCPKHPRLAGSRGAALPPSRGRGLSPSSEKWPGVITQKAPLELYQ